MFRDQRLGESRQDVLEYLSSRVADERIFQADLLVDKAHLVMLREQGLISGEVCSKIISALDGLMQAGPQSLGAGEDVHEAIEAHILSQVGPEGGRMHTGRSRNDEVATCIRLALRTEMLDLMAEQLSLISTLVRLAEKHTRDRHPRLYPHPACSADDPGPPSPGPCRCRPAGPGAAGGGLRAGEPEPPGGGGLCLHRL